MALMIQTSISGGTLFASVVWSKNSRTSITQIQFHTKATQSLILQGAFIPIWSGLRSGAGADTHRTSLFYISKGLEVCAWSRHDNLAWVHWTWEVIQVPISGLIKDNHEPRNQPLTIQVTGVTVACRDCTWIVIQNLEKDAIGNSRCSTLNFNSLFHPSFHPIFLAPKFTIVFPLLNLPPSLAYHFTSALWFILVVKPIHSTLHLIFTRSRCWQ